MEYYLGPMSGERSRKKPDAPIGVCGITHACPFCGKRASQGRVLNWIAGECILSGEAIFPCSSCGHPVSVPAAVFVQLSLQKLRSRVFNKATGQVDQRALFQEMIKMSARELLVPNWGEVIDSWNKESKR